MKRGDVVEIDWQFSDLTGSKIRPAVVVQADYLDGLVDDTILVKITTSRLQLAVGEIVVGMIDIYSKRRLGQARGDLEDDIGDFIGSAGEVTGGGSGGGWNIDLEITDIDNFEEWTKKITEFLRNWGVPKDTYLMIFSPDWIEGTAGRRVNVYSE